MRHDALLGVVVGSSTFIVGVRHAVCTRMPRMASVKVSHYYVIKSLNSKRKNQKKLQRFSSANPLSRHTPATTLMSSHSQHGTHAQSV
jgi:hypothetical protein